MLYQIIHRTEKTQTEKYRSHPMSLPEATQKAEDYNRFNQDRTWNAVYASVEPEVQLRSGDPFSVVQR